MTDLIAPVYKLSEEDGHLRLAVAGDWTVMTIGRLDSELRALDPRQAGLILDVSQLGHIDTAGAFIIDRTLNQLAEEEGQAPDIEGANSVTLALLTQVRALTTFDAPALDDRPYGLGALFGRIGEGMAIALQEALSMLAFLGETLVTCARLIIRPARIRWTATVSVMEEAGLDAMPIVAFLSFFVGMVIAFIGSTSLSDLGATIYTVELVGISMLREFGVILTAIILAGRTNSAFTAQIGAMKMRQEVDAMKTLGLSEMEVLVAPRVFAMLIMLPILTFIGTLAGLVGGGVVGWLALGITPGTFIGRLHDFVPIQHFWVGMSKAPVFALVLALIGCKQGLDVGGSVQSLGKRTTTSVVQALFSIIVIDAIFAIFYMELDI